MIGWLTFWTVWNAASVAVNTAFYVQEGRPLSLGSAIFCGLLFVVSLGWLLREVRR